MANWFEERHYNRPRLSPDGSTSLWHSEHTKTDATNSSCRLMILVATSCIAGVLSGVRIFCIFNPPVMRYISWNNCSRSRSSGKRLSRRSWLRNMLRPRRTFRLLVFLPLSYISKYYIVSTGIYRLCSQLVHTFRLVP